MGDDGIGPAVVRYLASNDLLPPNVTLEDLGTPSLDPAYSRRLRPRDLHRRR
jgi:Ni,Fe-hydrogenase maturation factor